MNDTGPFSRVGIVGFGLIGGSIALALKRRWPSSVVAAIDNRPSTKRRCRRAPRTSPARISRSSPTPISSCSRLRFCRTSRSSSACRVLRGQTLVTDTGSTKRRIVAAARQLPIGAVHRRTSDGRRGARRLVGGARRPVRRPSLDADAQRRTIAGWLARLDAFVTGLGAVPHIMTADLHDRLVGAVSHLPQLTASALMHVVGQAGRRRGPRACRPRPRRHDAAGREPGADLARHRRDQRGHAARRAGRADPHADRAARRPWKRRAHRRGLHLGHAMARGAAACAGGR